MNRHETQREQEKQANCPGIAAHGMGRKPGGDGRRYECRRHRPVNLAETRPNAKWALWIISFCVRLMTPPKTEPDALKFFRRLPIALQRLMVTCWQRLLVSTGQVRPHARHTLEDKALSVAVRGVGSGPRAGDAIASAKLGRQLFRCHGRWGHGRHRSFAADLGSSGSPTGAARPAIVRRPESQVKQSRAESSKPERRRI